ncbi:hypothetical protein [Nocardia sp. NPDC051570]|uniref:hypothetical protein n=1 Tax=Nocardia sp. NPDC051570 TaxID=3364324 RepID=UPI0037A8A7DB
MVHVFDLASTDAALGDRAFTAAHDALQHRMLAQLDQVTRRSTAPRTGRYPFVSRVLEMRGERGRFEPPASITAEYDVPADAWYALDGTVPAAVVLETTQCLGLLLEHLGIEPQPGHELRLLSADTIFHDRTPRTGQTIRVRLEVDRLETLDSGARVHFSHRCYLGDRLIAEMPQACAGFGDPDEVLSGSEYFGTQRGHRRRHPKDPTKFKPLERTDRECVTTDDIDLLTRGELAAVFGRYWDQRADGCNPSIRLPRSGIRTLTEITDIDRTGGSRGFGKLTATAAPSSLDVPGNSLSPVALLVEGAAHVLQVYAMYAGLHLVFPDGEFQPAFDVPTGMHLLAPLPTAARTITYGADVCDITLIPRPTVVADVTVYADGAPIIRLTDLAVQVREKPGTAIGIGADGVMPFLGRRNHDGEATYANEFHLALAGAGDFTQAIGSEFSEVLGVGKHMPRTPGGDYQRIDRIQSVDGKPGEFAEGVTLVTEYDSSPDWWYYHHNSTPTMPNFVYMEIALQSSLLLGYYMGGAFLFPEDDLYVRNLDGYATLTRPVDLRGKTIRQETVMLTRLPGSGVLLERFGFRLFADGELFYEGQTLYGYFPGEWLKHQKGMDAGKYRPSWLEEHPDPAGAHTVALRSEDRWFTPQPGTGLRLAGGRLRLIDDVTVVPGGGALGQGYVHGSRAIAASDWYFDVHNDLDKVMPGTLGIESLTQALQVYVMDTGLAADMGPVTFESPVGVQTRWSYRGQVEIHDGQMTFEVHIKEIRREPGRLLVIADGSVWKPGLRIYQVSDIAIEVRSLEESTR